jgi:hypothetical protein
VEIQTIHTKINQISAHILKNNHHGGADTIVINPKLQPIFETMEYFHILTDQPVGVGRVGSLSGRYSVYTDFNVEEDDMFIYNSNKPESVGLIKILNYNPLTDDIKPTNTMGFKVGKPLVDGMDFVPKREISFELKLEPILDMAHLVGDDKMYEMVAESVKKEFITFLKYDLPKQLAEQEKNTPKKLIQEMEELDKAMFNKNSIPQPIKRSDNKPRVKDFNVFQSDNIAWKIRWNSEGYSKDLEMGHGFGESPYQHRQTVMSQINKLNAQITKATMNTANMIFAHYKMMKFFESLETFQGTGTGNYKLGSKYEVYFTDKLPEEPVIYILSDEVFKLQTLPEETNKGDENSEVIFKPKHTFTREEVEQYKAKLVGSIIIDNYSIDG